jgi:hypothetical protein
VAIADAAPAVEAAGATSLGGEIEVALRMLSRNEPEAALAILSASYRDHPGDPTIRELMSRAEGSCRDNAIRVLEPSRVPRLAQPADQLGQVPLSATESYLTTLMDGKSDIRTLLWLAPMREIEVLQALKSLLDRGLIELSPSGRPPSL